MKLIAIAFTLKGQSFDDIKSSLTELSGQLGSKSGNVVLVHGFMPRQAVIDKGFGTEVVDTLAELFPLQLNCYSDGAPQRKQMADVLKSFKGDIYTIGEVKEGVAEEVDLYKANNIRILTLPLNWNGSMTDAPLSFGEKAVGLPFNPGGMPEVNQIKTASAAVIDELNNQRELAKAANNGEKIAQFTLAIRDIQSGQMWGVKAATWQY